MASNKWWPAAAEGVRKGWRGTRWMLKILVPCSLLAFVIDSSGALRQLDFLLAPAMGFLNMPPEAALPLTAGLLAGIYAAVAALAVLNLDLSATILVTVFLLISHNLVQEGIVQARSGLNFIKATFVRLAASVASVLCVAPFMPKGAGGANAPVVIFPPVMLPIAEQLQGWMWDTGVLCFQIYLIITAMMVVMELLRAARVIPKLARALKPVLWVMGLSPRVGILWLTATVFGLAYGAAVIVEETRTGGFQREEIERLQLSIGINHAVIEDPAIFLALGVPALWLWIPRLVAAFVFVHLYNLYSIFRVHRQTQPQAGAITGHGGPSR